MKIELEMFHQDDITGKLSAEASTLGFPVGRWPKTVEVTSPNQPDLIYNFVCPVHVNGDLGYVEYELKDAGGRNIGKQMIIFND